jgi:hypothetical protein
MYIMKYMNTIREPHIQINPALWVQDPSMGDTTHSILSWSLTREAEIEKFQAGMARIEELLTTQELTLDSLREWIHTSGWAQQILNSFLERAGVPLSSEYRNIVALALRKSDVGNFDSLIDAEMARLGITGELARQSRIRMENSFFDSLVSYYEGAQRALIQTIKTQQLLTPFYQAIFIESFELAKTFNVLTALWKDRVIDQTNSDLEERFWDPRELSDFLQTNNLIDTGKDWLPVGWSYTILVPKSTSSTRQDDPIEYQRMTLRWAYPVEMEAVLWSLARLKGQIAVWEDALFGQKDAYIYYLQALENALSSLDATTSIALWQEVDTCWMGITWPIQIVHPFESYLDNLRSTVGLQFDLRMSLPNAGVSCVRDTILQMVYAVAQDFPSIDPEQLALWVDGINKKKVYFVGLPIHGGEQFYGPPSAQVIPNDTKVSDQHGRKIFAFTRSEFNGIRTRPLLRIRQFAISEELLNQEKSLYTEARYKEYLQMYDQFIDGHEFGHGLWRLSAQSEPRMNISGAFKNIEEWQATAAAVVAYFGSQASQDPMSRENFLMELITRAVWLLRYYKTTDVIPYYTESLIHLELLFEAWVVAVDQDGKITLTHKEWGFEALKQAYDQEYRELVAAYLAEQDASIFLGRTTELKNGIYLPSRPELRAFVERFIGNYKVHGLAVVE